jgi:hypothetical protein
VIFPQQSFWTECTLLQTLSAGHSRFARRRSLASRNEAPWQLSVSRDGSPDFAVPMRSTTPTGRLVNTRVVAS